MMVIGDSSTDKQQKLATTSGTGAVNEENLVSTGPFLAVVPVLIVALIAALGLQSITKGDGESEQIWKGSTMNHESLAPVSHQDSKRKGCPRCPGALLPGLRSPPLSMATQRMIKPTTTNDMNVTKGAH